MRTVNPATGEPGPELAASTPQQVSEAIARARSAQGAWAARPIAERIALLKKVRQAFLEQAEALVEVLGEETGRPAGESWLSEVVPNGDLFDWWLSAGARHLRRERVSLNPINFPKKVAFIEHLPRGVVTLITPWNLPVAIPLRTLVPALLAGNAVVFKPSEHAPRCGAFLARLFTEVLGEGLVECVQGEGDTGAALVEGEVDLVVFTGSVKTGKVVSAACATRLVPCSLELGGNDAAIVLADAQLERAAEGIAWGACFNAGQNCAAVERVYVERAIAEDFLAKLQAVFERLRPRDDVGPLTTDFQLETVERHLGEAREKGAIVRCGGARPEGPGRYHLPTLVVVESDDLSLMREETFGPVLAVRIVDTAEEAVRLADDSPYGLTASIWTADVYRGWALGKDLQVGVLTVNNHSFTGGVPSLPWSGPKETGGGITNSHLALEKLTRPRTVLLDRSKAARELWWYPYNDTLVEIAVALRDGALGKLGSMLKLPGLLGKRFR
ncbi:MAG: aldehyde dehydrogenase family protein [Deltaproteobacteria bacterium]|nr:aldehyde dehydrogenase family protein [Deltaproteobacteria bacterium]